MTKLTYKHIDGDAVAKEIAETAARQAARNALISELHLEQFAALLKHDSHHVKRHAETHHPVHEKNAAKHRATAERRMKAAGLTGDDLVEEHRAELAQLVAMFERDHLAHTITIGDLEDAFANGEIDDTELAEIEPGKVMSMADIKAVQERDLAVLEAAISVFRAKLDELAPKEKPPAKPPATRRR